MICPVGQPKDHGGANVARLTRESLSSGPDEESIYAQILIKESRPGAYHGRHERTLLQMSHDAATRQAERGHRLPRVMRPMYARQWLLGSAPRHSMPVEGM